jgi:hypothetical protein
MVAEFIAVFLFQNLFSADNHTPILPAGKFVVIPFLRYAAYRNFGMPGLFQKPDATTSQAGGRASAALF